MNGFWWWITAFNQKQNVSDFGVKIEQVGSIGGLRLPSEAIQVLNNKLAAIQNASAAENSIKKASAEAQQKIEIAKGEALANQMLARSISKEFIQWRQLEILDKH